MSPYEKNYPFRKFPSDLDIFLAGADPYIHDKLGRLSLTSAGLLARDHLVLNFVKKWEVPLAITLAGGYGRNITDTVALHRQTIRAANEQA